MLMKERRSNNMQLKQDYIEMRLPASAEYVSLIRLIIRCIFSCWSFIDDIEDAKIAVSEAVTNAVNMHIKRCTDIGMINLCFEIFDDKIKIVISDQGESFDYEETKAKLGPYKDNENIDFLREGGLGLFLIESLMDEVTDKNSGVTISMIKYIKKSRCEIMARESKSVNDVSPEQINQWIMEHQNTRIQMHKINLLNIIKVD